MFAHLHNLAGAYLPVVLARRGQAAGVRSVNFVLGNMLSCGGECALRHYAVLDCARVCFATCSSHDLVIMLAESDVLLLHAVLVCDALTAARLQ